MKRKRGIPTDSLRAPAWLMLVALSFMLLSSALHFHNAPEHAQQASRQCSECVAHHHDGHISAPTLKQAECTLCQFLSTQFIAEDNSESYCAVDINRNPAIGQQPSIISSIAQSISGRAPPTLFS